MKERLEFLILSIIGLIIFIGVVLKVGFLNIVKVFLLGKWIYLLIYLGISLLIILTLVMRLKIILLSIKKDIPIKNLLKIHCSGFAYGYLSPIPLSGGEGIKAMLLKKEGVNYKEGFAAVIIDRSINEAITIIFSIIGLFLLITYLSLPMSILSSVIFGFIVSLGIMGWYYYRLLRGRSTFSALFKIFKFRRRFFLKYYEHIVETEKKVSNFFKKHKKTFFQTVALSLVSWIFMFAEYKTLLLIFGYDAGYIFLFMVITVVGITYVMPIPAALGVLEGGQMFLFKFTNMNPYHGFAVSILIRSRDLLISLIGLLNIFKISNKKYKNEPYN